MSGPKKDPPFEQRSQPTGEPIGSWRPMTRRPGERDPLILDLEEMEDGRPVVVSGLDSAAVEQGLVLRLIGRKLVVDRATDVEYVDELARVVSLTPMTQIQKRARLMRHARAEELVQRLEKSFAEFRDDLRARLTGDPER